MPATYPVIMSKKGNGTVGWLSAKTVEASGTQAYKSGELVLVGASGAVAITVTGSTTGVLGIATTDATGVTSTAAIVEVVEPGDILEMTLCNGSTTPVTAALSDLYKKYSLYVSGGSSFISQAAATFGQIVGFVLDSNGAFTSRVLVTVLPANLVVAAGL